MKIKKFDNIWLMGIILASALILGIYILKIFFPNLVIETAQVDSITRIGHYIDTHKWAWYLVSGLLSFFVYYLNCCACCRKKKLSLKENLFIICFIVLIYFIKRFLPDLYTPINICSNIILPCIFKAELKTTTFCFCFITFLQAITISIRGLKYMIIDYNYATLTILMIDIYIAQILLYCLLNYKKRR